MTHDSVHQPGSVRRGVSRAKAALAVCTGAVLVVFPAAVLGGALLLPVFANARERARQAACISHLKQIVMAAKMFADDWEGVFPNVGSYPEGKFYGDVWTPGKYWGDIIRDYVRAGEEIFKCPAVRNQEAPSYAWNRHLSHYREDRLQLPTTTPLAWDWVPREQTAPGIPLDPDPDSLDKWGYYPAGGALDKTDMARACSRHAGGLILGFVDGHAKFERPTRWTPQNRTGRFMACDDKAMRWPPKEYRGIVISMYPRDPMPR